MAEYNNSILTTNLDHNLVAWLPDAAGSFPVIYFNTGVGGMVPSWCYSLMMKQIGKVYNS